MCGKVRFEVLTVVKMFTLHPEVGGGTFLRNVGYHPLDHTASRPRRPQSTPSPPRQPQIESVQEQGAEKILRTDREEVYLLGFGPFCYYPLYA
jgi:hypothetical protein